MNLKKDDLNIGADEKRITSACLATMSRVLDEVKKSTKYNRYSNLFYNVLKETYKENKKIYIQSLVRTNLSQILLAFCFIFVAAYLAVLFLTISIFSENARLVCVSLFLIAISVLNIDLTFTIKAIAYGMRGHRYIKHYEYIKFFDSLLISDISFFSKIKPKKVVRDLDSFVNCSFFPCGYIQDQVFYLGIAAENYRPYFEKERKVEEYLDKVYNSKEKFDKIDLLKNNNPRLRNILDISCKHYNETLSLQANNIESIITMLFDLKLSEIGEAETVDQICNLYLEIIELLFKDGEKTQMKSLKRLLL